MFNFGLRTEDHFKIFAESLLVGSLSAAVSNTIASPFNNAYLTLKNTIQGASSLRLNHFVELKRNYTNKNVLVTMRDLFANNFKYMRLPSNSLNLALYNYIENLFGHYQSHLLHKLKSNHMTGYLSGLLTGLTSGIVMYPINSFRRSLSSTFRLKGLSTALLSSSCYRTLYFGNYEYLKGKFIKREDGFSFMNRYYCSQLNTLLTHFICYPIESLSYESNTSTQPKPSTFQKIRRISSLYSGCVSNSYRTIAPSLVLVFFDFFSPPLKELFNNN